MNDSINRQMAINTLIRESQADGAYGYLDAKSIVDVLERMPSEQSERKKGKWINDNGLYKCSSCKQLWTEWWAISKPIERMRKECPYCPMCGSYNGEN